MLEEWMLDNIGSGTSLMVVLSLVWWRLRRVEDDVAEVTRRFNDYLQERAE